MKNCMKPSRRKFIQKVASGAIASIGIPLISTGTGFADMAANNTAGPGSIMPLGIAGYTFNKFDVAKSISMMKRLGVQYLSLKDVHLPINSSDDKIRAVLNEFSSASINIYAVGVIYMKTRQAVDDAFAYAKKVGVKLIVGVPGYDLLDYTEQKVKETDIKVAIHNHGPEDAFYPGPEQVYDRIKNRDSRMGLCLDIGHAKRTGTNLEKAISEYRSRLFDLHIKDVNIAAKEGKAAEIGRGVIDFKSLIQALQKNRYAGICTIEFEKDMEDPLPGLAESVGYFRGVMSTIS